MILAHWTYTREEWKNFVRWTHRKRSIFHYIWHLLAPRRQRQTPEVRITREKVWIGEGHQHFRSQEHSLKAISIRSEGNLNIMEITFEQNSGRPGDLNEIHVPVPKGKLREAIAIQDKITNPLYPC